MIPYIFYGVYDGATGPTPYVISDNTGSSFSGTRDGNNWGRSTSNFGTGTTWTIGHWDDSSSVDTRRGFLAFDGLSSVPAGTVTNAKIRLYVTAVVTNGTFNFHRITRSWVENQFNWDDYSTGNAWTTVGGDFNATVVASKTINSSDVGTYVEITGTGLTQLVQDWLDGTFANHGVLIKSPTETGAPVISTDIRAKEGTNGQRPELTFDLTPAGGASQNLTVGLYNNTNTFYSATVSQGGTTQSLVASLFTNTNTFYSGTLSNSYNLSTSLYTDADIFYTATITRSNILSAGLFTNTNTFYTATLTGGAVNLVPVLFNNTNTFYTAIISSGSLILQPNLYTNSNTFYTIAVSSRVTLTPSLFTNTNTFYNASISGLQSLIASLFTNTQVFYTVIVSNSTDNFRITELGDNRYTEQNDSRILEADSSSSNLVGTGSISAAISISKAGRLEVTGQGLLAVSGQVLPFQSTVYIKVAGIWKLATPFVKLNNNWVTPKYIGKKVSGNWRRIY